MEVLLKVLRSLEGLEYYKFFGGIPGRFEVFRTFKVLGTSSKGLKKLLELLLEEGSFRGFEGLRRLRY